MLTDKLKEDIGRVDILSDFDEVMVKGQNAYREVFAYFLYLPILEKIKFMEKARRKYFEYMKTGNVRTFYEMFEGCPVEVVDKVVPNFKQNEKWYRLAEGLKVGVVSRNNRRLILKYIISHLSEFEKQHIKADIIATNEPEIAGNVYTGNVEIKVNNNNLIDFVREKDYICGDDEKRILEHFGVNSLKAGDGLYICSKQKSFKDGIYIVEFDEKSENIKEKRN